MKRFNSIAVVPVRSLEVGDLIAFEIVRTIVSGKITGIASYPNQLTIEQEKYMRENNLDVPDSPFESLAGHHACIVFGEFIGAGKNVDQPKHAYLNLDVNVAVFFPRQD